MTDPAPNYNQVEQAWNNISDEFRFFDHYVPNNPRLLELGLGIIQEIIKFEIGHITVHETKRWLYTLENPDYATRNNAAWHMREGIKRAVFPYPEFDREKVSAVRTAFVDKYGRSAEGARTRISFLFTQAWLIVTGMGLNVGPVEDYIITGGKKLIEESVNRKFGEMLYLYPKYYQETTGNISQFPYRFADDMLFVPEGYEQAEKDYQRNLVAQQELQRVQQAQAVQAQAVAKAQAKQRREAVYGVLGAAADFLDNSQARADQKRSDKHRATVEENSRILNKQLKEQEAAKRRREWGLK